jgi:hypothetical protein
LFVAARLSWLVVGVAINGGPPLVIGCRGSPWVADRPDFREVPALRVSGRAAALGVQPPGPLSD